MFGFDVYTDDMRAHAEKVRQVGDRLGKGLDAAGQTTMNTEAFGLIGQFLVPVVMSVQGVATGAIGAAKLGTEGMAGGITAAANLYDEVEDGETAKWAQGGN